MLSNYFFYFLVLGIAASNNYGHHDLKGREQETLQNSLLIDSFSRPDARSELGTIWRGFSDQVMGGVSSARFTMSTIQDRKCIHLQGSVSLENNGGFVQVALDLNAEGNTLDAGSYQGIRLCVRGNGKSYYLHLRTAQTTRPWQYYAAPFSTSEEWLSVEIPFASFTKENLGVELDTSSLKRIAIVGAWDNFKADVAVCRLEFYK